MSFFVVFI